MLLAVLGYARAQADYSVDFNTAIATGNHDFAVAAKWGHIVPQSDYDGYGPYYMSYSYAETEGVDGSGALFAGRQYAGDYGGGEEVYDLLVTPAVSGTITLDIKASNLASSSNPAYVEFYALNAAGTAHGQLLKTVKQEIPGYSTGSQTRYITATLDVASSQKIGIRVQNAYIDNFTATDAVLPTETSLSVQSVKNSEGYTGTGGSTTYFNQQADGSLLVNLKVDLANTGDVDFVSGVTEGYTLTLATATSAGGSKTYYEAQTIPVPVSLAAGEVKQNVDVSFTIPYPSSSWLYFFVRENITGTTSSSNRYAGVKTYEPKFVFVEAKTSVGNSTSSLTDEQAFGLVSESVTQQYKLYNMGNAPLVVKSVTLPEGFTSENVPTAETTIAPGESIDIDITLPVTTTGNFAGQLSIVYLNAAGTETTYTLPFTGSVLAEGTWFCDFNGSKTSASTASYPQGTVVESSTLYAAATGSYNSYDQYLRSYNRREANKFITPKLHFEAGQTMTFDALKVQSGAYDIQVYISSDRVEWGSAVLTVSNTDSRLAATNTRYTYTLTLPAGDYYIAFDIYGMGLDNIIGGQKVDVAHDLYIKGVTWPHEAGESIKSGSAQTRPSVEVIPLTNESASGYTVRYLYGDNVAEGTPVALTASATGSRKFEFAYTPVVEQTTTFEGTKVVFTFTDGTTIETEPFDLTVTNEPKFHFVNTIPSSKWYEPTDRTQPIEFGRTNAAETQSFYIYNWGSAPLTVKEVRLPEGFTTSLTVPATVAPFDENNLPAAAQAIDIIFSSAAPGDFSGNMEIVYIDGTGADAVFTLPVSGTMLDASKWYAPFDDNSWPLGATYQDNMSLTYVTTGNYAISSSSTTDHLFITPKLTATAGEKFTFDAKLYGTSWLNGQVVVYLAETRDDLTDTEAGQRQEIFRVSGDDQLTTDFQTFAFTIPSAGGYYLGFEVSNRAYVDELYGLVLADAGLDLDLASYNIPTAGMQNIPLSATLNVRNFGLSDVAAADYFVVATIGEVKSTVSQGTVAIPMTPKLSADGAVVSVSIQSPKAGTYPVTIALTDSEGNILVETDPVNVTFAEETASGELVIGNKKSTSTYIPFYSTWMDDSSGKSMADFIYTPEQLAAFGLTTGATITQIKYIGTPNGTKDINKLSVDVWVAQQSVADFVAGSPDQNAMTHVQLYDNEPVTFTKDVAHEFIIDLSDNPIVYDGESGIRIFTNINGHGQYQGIAFDIDTDYPSAYYAHGSGAYSEVKGKPVAYLSLAVEPVMLAGTVTTEAGDAVADATVTLVSTDGDDVQYEGTTDAEGRYSIQVIQTTRHYDVTVSAEGYDEATADDIDMAEAVEGVLTQDFTLTATPEYVEVTILEGRTGTTLSSPYALDLSDVEGLTAYKAIGKVTTNAAYIITDEVNVVAPAETGLLLKGAAGTYQIPVAQAGEADEAAFADNLLEAALNGYTPTDDDIASQTVYRYVKVGDECGFQLVTSTTQTLAAGKAYLRLTAELAAAAAMWGLTFDEGVATSIDAVASEQLNVDAPMYNIAGQRVSKSHKGVVIQNGKKFIKK